MNLFASIGNSPLLHLPEGTNTFHIVLVIKLLDQKVPYTHHQNLYCDPARRISQERGGKKKKKRLCRSTARPNARFGILPRVIYIYIYIYSKSHDYYHSLARVLWSRQEHLQSTFGFCLAVSLYSANHTLSITALGSKRLLYYLNIYIHI